MPKPDANDPFKHPGPSAVERRGFGGVELYLNPMDLNPSMLLAADNCVNRGGQLYVRPGLQGMFGSTPPSSSSSSSGSPISSSSSHVSSSTSHGPSSSSSSGSMVSSSSSTVSSSSSSAMSSSSSSGVSSSSSSSSSPVIPDLVAYWPFSEGSGTTTADVSGNGNTGTLSGSPLPSWTTGQDGNALAFNGTGYVNCGTGASIEIAGPITISFWINPSAATSYNLLISNYDGGSGGGYEVYRGEPPINNTITFQGINAGVMIDGRYPSLSNGVFTNVTCVYDNSKCYVYYNGVLQTLIGDTDNWGPNAIGASTRPILIGARSAVSPNFILNSAVMDEVRIYSRALTPTEVAQIYAMG